MQPHANKRNSSILGEKPLSLAQAARVVPHADEDSPPNPATIYRWIRRGICGVHLESLRVGRRLYTSAEAVRRFLTRVTLANQVSCQPNGKQARRATRDKPHHRKPRGSAERERAVARARDRCIESMGARSHLGRRKRGRGR